MRAGVIQNPRSHRNHTASPAGEADGVLYASPTTPEALTAALASFAAEGVELLVVDGGDGTVRDVLSQLPEIFLRTAPLIAIVPSGKTNMLARDLGAPPHWTADAAVAQARAGVGVKRRTPLEIRWTDRPERKMLGFVFGTGAYVRATRLAQTAHKAGFFHDAAVAVTLAGAIARTLTGGPRDPWRTGEPLELALDDEPPRAGRRFLVLASTLQRFPMGMKPFGPASEGLRVLEIDAPPRRLWRALAAVMSGRGDRWLAGHGFRRGGARALRLQATDGFILDGEFYPGGELTVVPGPTFTFVAPFPS